MLVSICCIGCGASTLRYSPTELISFHARNGATELVFQTERGRQVAYYLPPGGNPSQPPRPLIILFPGIASKALDRLDWADCFIRHFPAGVLLLDYPGRGQCEGSLRPKHLPQTYTKALQALALQTGLQPSVMEADIRLVGHSFGTAAALRFAQHYSSKRIILLAPLTTVRQALFLKVGPLAWLIPDNLDNREMVREITARPLHPSVTIFHGAQDNDIPLSMGQALKEEAPEHIELVVLTDADHMTIMTEHLDLIEAHLFDRPVEP